VPPWVVAAAAYEAWTGHVAEVAQPGAPPRPDDDPAAAIPQLWWWSQAEDPQDVHERVAAALPDGAESWVDPSGEPGWQAVITNLGLGRAAEGLRLLRDAVAAVRPSWAAVQPAGGLAVPGMDPSLPMTGVLANPWISRAWAGSELPELEAALAGTHREELAGGVLWVTDPRLADLPDDSWADDDVRWESSAAVGPRARLGASSAPGSSRASQPPTATAFVGTVAIAGLRPSADAFSSIVPGVVVLRTMTRLTPRKKPPFGFSVFARRMPANAGVSVSALNAEIAIENAIVSANC